MTVPHRSLTSLLLEIRSVRREIAEVEGVAAGAETSTEIKTGEEEQRRLLEEAFELQLQLMGLKEKYSSDVAGDEP